MTELSDQRIKHLDMLQRAIERMARESAAMKQYCLASVAATASVSVGVHAWGLALAGAALVIVFWYLDAMYLAQERWFRAMYDDTRAAPPDTLTTFVMTPPDPIRARHTVSDSLWGWSTRTLYIALFVLLVLVAIAEALG